MCMRDDVQQIDVAELDAAWNGSWSASPPAAHLLRRRFAERWVRFHTLPNAKRYATSDAERAEILHRYRLLLGALLSDAMPGGETLLAITCSWSPTSAPTQRDPAVAATTPGAAYWRSDDLATDPGFHSWQHHYVSRLDMTDTALDQLLLCAANDMTDGVILTNHTCSWVFHPYDGGVDIFTVNIEHRDQLSTAYADWLAPVSSGT